MFITTTKSVIPNNNRQ